MDERIQERIYDVQHNQKLDKLDPEVQKVYQYVVNKEVELTKAYGLIRPNHRTPFEYASEYFDMTVDEVMKILLEASEKFKNPL